MNNLCKILIIDDESILRHGLKHLCNWEEEQFCIVGEASNGEEALQMIEALSPHIIITDVVMPIIDGIELSKIVDHLYPDIKIIILSSFSDFDYVREGFKHGAFDYLLKATLTSSNLLEVLKKVRAETSWNSDNKTRPESVLDISHLIHQLINKQLSETSSQMNILSNYFSKEEFIILSASLDFLDYQSTYTKDDLQQNAAKLANYYLAPYIYANVLLDNRYILILNFDKDKDIKIDLEKFTGKLKNTSPLAFISSHHFVGVENIKKIDCQLADLLPQSFFFHDQPLISVNALLKPGQPPRFDFNVFENHIKDLNFETAYENLKKYFNKVLQNLAPDDYSLKRFCQNIIYTLLNTCEELGFDLSDINHSKIRLFKEIDFAPTFYDLEKIIFNILENISTLVNLQAKQNNSVLITQIKQYVEENYSQDISLTDISQALHINYYYMSSYFKAHTSENLSTYINKVRVEKAKGLLSDKTIPIAHVSEMVGFSEHNYFSKVFKRYTKLTPTAYRRKVLRA